MTEYLYINADGPDNEAVRRGLIWLSNTPENQEAILMIPTFRNLEGVIETVIGTEGKKTLLKNKEAHFDGKMVKLCTNQSFRHTHLPVRMLAVYQDSKSLDEIESSYSNLESIMVIPWGSSDIDEWKEIRQARYYG